MLSGIIPFYTPFNRLLVRSKGCCLYDSDGREYIDFESGVWCANLGHGHDRLKALIRRQTEESIHHGYLFRNRQSEELSGELARLTGLAGGASVFLSSGSEAVNLAITLARHLTGRKKVLKIDHSYLSAYGFGRISPENEDLIEVEFNNLSSSGHIDFDTLAAFVVETGGASIGIIRFPGTGFIQQLIDRCRKHHCPVIADEVTTGMGRTGAWFGYQHYDFLPDMVVTGKGLGNGFPVSGLTISAALAQQFTPATFRYAQSHQNDPLGCAIGREVIKIIEEDDLIKGCNTAGSYFREALEQLLSRHQDKIKEVRARGLMLGLEFHKNINGEKIHELLFEKGFVTGFRMNTLRFLPPLTIGMHQIDRFTDTLNLILGEK